MAECRICPPGTVQGLPRVTMEMQWCCGYWDGPLDGVGIVGGSPVWFQCPRGNEWHRHRVFVLYPLTGGELAAETDRHDEFVRRVRQGDQASRDEYYRSPKAERPAYWEREPIGFYSRPSLHRRSRSARYWAIRNG